MLCQEDKSDARYQITAYDDASVTVSGEVQKQSFIIFPSQLITQWPPQSLIELNLDHLAPILESPPEVLIIGCGQQSMRLPVSLRDIFERNNIGVECMTTPAACRSYMILLSEDRDTAAILFL